MISRFKGGDVLVIIEDTRQQAKKHDLKNQYFADNQIKVVRSKLPVGDYALLTDMSTVIDTKKDLQELIGNVTQQHKRFVTECDFAAENGIKLIILVADEKVKCINDLFGWYNYRLRHSPKATKGSTLAKILMGMEARHSVKFMFCTNAEMGQKIVEILGGA